MKLIIKLTLSLSLVSLLSFGQSHLIFQNVKDSSNIYRLPLGKFPILLKLTDTLAFNAVLDSYTDNVLQVRMQAKGKVIDSAITVLKQGNFTLIKAEPNKKDSLDSELDKKINLVKYPRARSIEITKIKTITIYNHYYPASNKKIRLANVACAVFLAGTLLVSPTKNPYLIGSGIGLTATAFIVKSSLATKDLDLMVPKRAKLRKKWKLARMQE